MLNQENVVEEFINNYSDQNKAQMEFKWNGQKGYEEGGDDNLDFRRDVIDLVLSGNVIAPDVLVKDLFEIESIFSREAYGAGDILAELGDLLLNQTGAKYIEDYFNGKGQSFDTENTVIPYGVSKEKLESIVYELKDKIDRESKIQNLDYFIGYYEDYIEAKA
jgi:hypothetical protein